LLVSALVLASACSDRVAGSGDEAHTEGATHADATGGETSSDVMLGPCAQYIECVMEAAPHSVSDVVATYGEEGTCWDRPGVREEHCWADCSGQMKLLREAHPDALSCWACSSDEECPDAAPRCSAVTHECEAEESTGALVAYRFSCMDVRQIGDADGSVLQAMVLENAWNGDIQSYALNVVLSVLSRDLPTMTATVSMGSGVGMSSSQLCQQHDTLTGPLVIDHDPEIGSWMSSQQASTCSTPSSGVNHAGTYTLELGANEVVYLYAEADDGTPFHCRPNPSPPDALPLRAVHAEWTANAAEDELAGVLTGCLLESEAEAVCSCIGACAGDGPGDVQTEGECAGCPQGAHPFRSLLGAIGTSDRCSAIVGAPAFDLTLGFTAHALPSIPETCG
jgi:hypothetical protein